MSEFWSEQAPLMAVAFGLVVVCTVVSALMVFWLNRRPFEHEWERQRLMRFYREEEEKRTRKGPTVGELEELHEAQEQLRPMTRVRMKRTVN